MSIPKYPEILIPPYEVIDDNNLDPQVLTYRAPNVPVLYLDSNFNRNPNANANSVLISTNFGNPESKPNIMINKVRRLAVKKFSLFFFLDNVVTGYNDVLTFGQQINPGATNTTFSITIPPDTYTDIASLGQVIEDLLNAYYVIYGVDPPVATVTFNPPPANATGLYGQLVISVVWDGLGPSTEVLLSVDPSSPFANTDMIALPRSNTFPVPTLGFPEAKLSFVSLTPYRFIDILSRALTNDAKIQSTNNLNTNTGTIIHRIYNPQYGDNIEVMKEPLNWINIRNDTNLTHIDFTFVGEDGVPIRGAINRDFNWLMSIALEK